MAAVQVEGHDGVRVMTVHAAKGLEFPVVAVADLGRAARAGSRDGDVAIGRIDGDRAGDADGRRASACGCRSRPPSPLRLWELVELCEDERARRRRGGLPARLRGGHASPGPADPQRHLPLVRPRSPRGAEAGALGAEAAAPGARRAGLGAAATERCDARPGAGGRGRPVRRAGSRGSRCASRHRARSERPSFAAGSLAGAGRRRRARRGPAHLLEGLGPPQRPAASPTPRSPPTPAAATASTSSGCSACEAPTVREEPRRGRPGGGERPQSRRAARSGRGPRERSLAIGNAVHAALEASARRSWAPPGDAELEAILAREGLGGDGEARERVEALVEGWLASELRAELDASGARSGPRSRSCSGWGARSCAERSTCWPSAPTAPWSSTTRPTRSAAPTRPSWRSATGPSATSTRSPSTARAKWGRGERRAAYCFLEAPDAPSVETYDEARAGAARERLEALVAGIRAGALRAHRRPPPRALLRLPGGGAALRAARLDGRSGPPRQHGERLAVFAYGSLVSLPSAERTLGRPVASARRRRGWPAGGGAGRRRATTCAPRRPSPSPTARAPALLPRPQRRARAPAPGPNGALIEVSEAELDRLDRARDPLRPGRGDRRDRGRGRRRLRPRGHLHREAEQLRPDAASRARSSSPPTPARSRRRSADLGPGELELYRATTDPRPVEVVEGVLVRDGSRAGNPREW